MQKGQTGEAWDAYDGNFDLIPGVTLIRGQTMPEGLYHLVCCTIVRHRDGEYLLMRRDGQKTFGGMWEATAGGSALHGETPLECAARELREETGIVPDSFTELGRDRDDAHHALFVEYLCLTDQDKDSVVVQPGETTAWRWVSRSELFDMPRAELLSQHMLMYVRQGKA